MIYDEDFKVIDVFASYKDKDDIACIEIVTGEFKGTKFNFGAISVDEQNDRATISFDYHLHNNEHLNESPHKEQFELVLEKIMNSVLHHALESYERQLNNESGKEDPSEVGE